MEKRTFSVSLNSDLDEKNALKSLNSIGIEIGVGKDANAKSKSRKDNIKLKAVLNSDDKNIEVINLNKANLGGFKRKCARHGIKVAALKDNKTQKVTLVFETKKDKSLKVRIEAVNKDYEKNKQRKSLKERKAEARERKNEAREQKQLAKEQKKSKEQSL